MAETETVTVTLSTGDEAEDIEVAQALVDHLGEEGDSAVDVVGDIAMLGLAQQVHGAVHHGHADTGPALEAAEEHTLEDFEARFGRSFAEMTGHDH